MDCISISTFRSLEQQAIRQYKELKARENGYRYIPRETFGHEFISLNRIFNEPSPEITTNKNKISYFA